MGVGDWRSFFEMLGINLRDLVAGFAGGVVSALTFGRNVNAFSVVGSMIVGALTANYLSADASRILGTSKEATAFIVGLCGMAICQGIVDAVTRWRQRLKERL